MKFGEWSDYCLPLVKSRMKANTYHNNYEIPLYLHLQPYFGEWEPREIKTSMVQQFVDIKGERYEGDTTADIIRDIREFREGVAG